MSTFESDTKINKLKMKLQKLKKKQTKITQFNKDDNEKGYDNDAKPVLLLTNNSTLCINDTQVDFDDASAADLRGSNPYAGMTDIEICYKKIEENFPCFEILYHKFELITTRFTSLTYSENKLAKEKLWENDPIEHQGPNNINVGSLYGVSLIMTPNIAKTKYLFVLDMNNTTNKIMGIGLIKNILYKNQNIKIYENDKFNKYIYKSNFYIDLFQSEYRNVYHDYIDQSFIQMIENDLEPLCFKGKTNLKRGGGFTRIPVHKINLDLMKKIIKLFIQINPNDFRQIILKRF